MDFEISPKSQQWRKKLQTFFDREVLPRHRAWVEHVADSRRALIQKAVWLDALISDLCGSSQRSRKVLSQLRSNREQFQAHLNGSLHA